MSSDETDVALLRKEMRQSDTAGELNAVERGDLEETFSPLFEAADGDDGDENTSLGNRLTQRNSMERTTLRIPSGMLDAVDIAVEKGQYADRSKAIRDAVREKFMEQSGPRRERGGRR